MKSKLYVPTVVALFALVVSGAPGPSIPQAPRIFLSYATFLGGSGVDDCDGLGINRRGDFTRQRGCITTLNPV